MNEKPTNVNPDQAWFWTDKWQAMEREADGDKAAGRVFQFDDADALFAALDAEGEEHERLLAVARRKYERCNA